MDYECLQSTTDSPNSVVSQCHNLKRSGKRHMLSFRQRIAFILLAILIVGCGVSPLVNQMIGGRNIENMLTKSFIEILAHTALANGSQPTGVMLASVVEIRNNPVSSNDDVGLANVSAPNGVDQSEGDTSDLSLGSHVFTDTNNNGLFDDGEVGIPNVDISLYDVNNSLVATATTGISGTYIITGLGTGSYYVIIQSPPTMAPTVSSITAPDNDQIDNNNNGEQPGGPGAPVISPIIDLAPGAEPLDESGPGGDQDDSNDSNGDMTIDFGFLPSALNVSIGNYIWHDEDQDGIQDADESGIEGVTVQLYDTNRGVPILGEDDNPLTGVTDINGEYRFEALPPGNYYVVLENIPDDFQATIQNAGDDDAIDSDLYANVSQTLPTGPLFDDDVYVDLDAGLYDSQAGMIGAINGYVWYDHDGDGIAGTDPNEYGLSTVSISLYDSGNNVVNTTTSDTDGLYTFARVRPGQYSLGFARLNDFLVPVWANSGTNDSLDSDINREDRTESIRVVEGDDISDVDAGYALAAELGVNFWNDANQNGIREGTEEAISGAQVDLVNTSGAQLTFLLTDSNGNGRFMIPPGTYRLRFVAPAGYSISPQSRSADLDNDADADGLTDVITLFPSDSQSGWNAGAFQQGPSSLGEGNEPIESDFSLFIPLYR